jgi:hypothetical protein
MTGPAGNWHYARRRHLRICREEVWGECPERPAWLTVPVFGDGFKLKATSPHFSPGSAFGGYRRTVQLGYVRQVAGEFVSLAWPQTAAVLLEMTLERDAIDLHSYCMDYYSPADPRRCLGVMVDQLQMSARPPRWDVVFRLGLKARTEGASPALLESDFDYAGLSPVPLRFERASVSLNGTPMTDVEAFSVQVQNNLEEGPNRGGAVGFLIAGCRAVSLDLTMLDDSDAINDAIRNDGAMSFQATLTHPEGHTLALSLPALHPQTNPEEAEPGQLARGLVHMEAGTDSQGNDITYALHLDG